VRRGSCPFVKKAEEVQAAGGRVMVVGSLHPYILRMVRKFDMCFWCCFVLFRLCFPFRIVLTVAPIKQDEKLFSIFCVFHLFIKAFTVPIFFIHRAWSLVGKG